MVDKLLTLFLAALLGTDIVTKLLPVASGFGVAMWLCAYAVLGAAALRLLAGMLRRGDLTTVLVLVSITAALLFLALLPDRAHHETTQQAACALGKFSVPDFGFHDWCFLGYPTRQYYLSALPSLLLGRSTFALNLGNILFLALGLAWFGAGLHALARGRAWVGDAVAATAVLSVLHLGHLRELLFNFEQTLVPLSHALLLCGAFSAWHASGRRRDFLMLLLAGYVTPYTYTPSLALIPLLSLFILFWKPSVPSEIGLVGRIMGLLYIASATAFSIFQRTDVRLSSGDGSSDVPDKALRALSFFTGQEGMLLIDWPGLLLAALALLLLFVLLARLLFSRSRNDLPPPQALVRGTFWLCCVAGWIVVVVVASAVSRGYANPDLPFSLHRAMIAPPVLITAAAILVHALWRPSVFLSLLLVLTMLFSAATATLAYWSAYTRIFPEMKVAVLAELDKQQREPATTERPLRLCFDAPLQFPLGNIGDFAQYFPPAINYDFPLNCAGEAPGKVPQECRAIVVPALDGHCACPAFEHLLAEATVITIGSQSVCVRTL